MAREPEHALRLRLARDIGYALGRIGLPVLLLLLLPFAYSIWSFYTLGLGSTHYLHTYLPLVGSLLSAVSVQIYPLAMTLGRSWLAGLSAFSGFVPYAFSLYVMLVLGAYRLYLLTLQFRVGSFVAGFFWLLIGYAMLYRFWLFTEAVAKAAQVRGQVLSSIADQSPGSRPDDSGQRTGEI